jgi:hypothetical protein
LLLARDMERPNVVVKGLRMLIIVHKEDVTLSSRPFVNIVIINPGEHRKRRLSKDRSRQRGGFERSHRNRNGGHGRD